ncbi:unnamed protein product [Cuscuta campestris]|uniref:BHLH domain-containing protein n=1 Tax=Cuscuta campestris TaxID=132261 RepID=A0A484LNL2_9ASTE|nr:unnamed protein product [Cuscuta campestris]
MGSSSSSGGGGGGQATARTDLMFHEMSPVLPWPVHGFNPASTFQTGHEPDHFLLPPASASPYGGLFGGRRHDGAGDHFRGIISDAHQPGFGVPFGLQAELQKMTAQEIMDAKALAASKSHSEAERRRRERINNHLAKLRSLLPNTTKTDKASLLAEVIQHVKELRRQTSLISETTLIPTETDELTVDTAANDGKPMIRASLCCEDRPDLIKALKALRLRTLKAEITTVGGRVRNVLFVTGEDRFRQDGGPPQLCSISSIQEALRAVIEKGSGGGGGDDHSSGAAGSSKRQRTNNNNIDILETN